MEEIQLVFFYIINYINWDLFKIGVYEFGKSKGIPEETC